MRKYLLAFAIVIFAISGAFADLRDDYDVVIAGAGTGGCAAAIQASSMGMRVLLVESSSSIGGQAIAAGVCTMDDLSLQESGIYLEFMNRIRDYYSRRGKSIGTCYWDSISKAFEPHVGAKILRDMLTANANSPDILLKSEIIAVNVQASRVNSVLVKTPNELRNITCKILIDATEYGDILPLTGAEYRAGNASPDAMIQNITWVAILRKYPDGIPENLRPKKSLPNYDFAKWNYENYLTRDGADFSGYPITLPVNFVTYNAYRGLPDSFSTGNYDSDSQTRSEIMKTCVNLGNEFPGKYLWRGRMGLPVAYLEDRNLRARIERDALIQTLHFVYYIQNELHENWSVETNEYHDLPHAAEDLPPEWQEIARHMPPIPYVRESRRIIAEHVLTTQELFENSLSYRDGNKNDEIQDAIAIGCYAFDLHGGNTDLDMEADLGERVEYAISHKPRGNFQVPLSILIPKKIDGLIAAEKNLSMSRLAAGALRLQPITMMTGQAAGALAALSVMNAKQPREISALQVQRELLDSGVDLSLCMYSDVPKSHRYYTSIQIANLYRLIEPLEYPDLQSYNISDVSNDNPKVVGVFGVEQVISGDDMLKMMERAEKITGKKISLYTNENTTRGQAVDLIVRAMEKIEKE